MKVNYPLNVCKNCYSNVAEIKVNKSPESNEKIEVCYDCYLELQNPELLEEELLNLDKEDENEKH